MKYQEQLKIYDELVARCTRFERKGKTMPYTSANGHMFSLFNKAGEIGIRFPKEVQKKYMEEYNTTILFSSFLFSKECLRRETLPEQRNLPSRFYRQRLPVFVY